MFIPYPIKLIYRATREFLARRSIRKWSKFTSEHEFERSIKKRFFLFSREYAILPWGTSIVDYSEPDFGVPMWWDTFGTILKDPQAEESALDLGPNQSYLLDVMKSKGFRTVSIDYSPGVVVIQKLRGHESIYGDYASTTIDELTGGRKFDVITCKGAINLDAIKDLRGFLESLKASLKEGGIALVTPTNSESSHSERYAFSFENYKSMYQKVFFDSGFEEVSVPGLNTPTWKFPVTLAFGDKSRLHLAKE